MLFNTIEFALFLPIVLGLYYLLPAKYRWVLLLAASYFFYMSWKVEYIFLIIISTLIDYSTGLKMDQLETRKKRLPYLILSLCSNLGLLFFFKYYNFAADNVNFLFEKFSVDGELSMMSYLLPVGISFYTFQTLSYSIDVYFGRQKAEKHLGYFALYVSYFPQLVAGPIERFSRLTPQLKKNQAFTYANFANGLRLILFGLFIKMVIADNLSSIVERVYENPSAFTSLQLWIGAVFYSFQIYSDFFGYSIIAIGSSLMLGITLIDNFKTPYLAKGIGEFWQRWHISLSTWFRDYLYYPLGGNRVKKSRWFLNICIVFIVSGFWHGANWTFIAWGALYGVVYIIEKLSNEAFNFKAEAKAFSVKHLLLALKTFILVTIIWVFFRSQNIAEAFEYIKLMFVNNQGEAKSLAVPNYVWLFLGLFILSDFVLYNKRFDTWVSNQSTKIRWTVYTLLIFAIIVFAGVEDFAFIYFQF